MEALNKALESEVAAKVLGDKGGAAAGVLKDIEKGAKSSVEQTKETLKSSDPKKAAQEGVDQAGENLKDTGNKIKGLFK